MNKIVIITDSSSCLDSKTMALYGVSEIVPMHYRLEDKLFDADGDWKVQSPKEYYDMMRNGALFKSAQITCEQYKESFKKYLDQGFDILSISCTGALSSSVKESFRAKDELAPLYPNQKIVCVDSANCHYSMSMMIKDVAKMRDEGKTLEDMVAFIEKNKLFYNEIGTVDKLTYLRAAGRVSASAAFFGGIFSVKPIVVYDLEGHNVAIEKVKGRKKSFEVIGDYIEKYGLIKERPEIHILHADCLDEAKELGDIIQSHFDFEIEFTYGYIEPGVGSSVGPGGIVIAFYGKKELRELNK